MNYSKKEVEYIDRCQKPGNCKQCYIANCVKAIPYKAMILRLIEEGVITPIKKQNKEREK